MHEMLLYCISIGITADTNVHVWHEDMTPHLHALTIQHMAFNELFMSLCKRISPAVYSQQIAMLCLCTYITYIQSHLPCYPTCSCSCVSTLVKTRVLAKGRPASAKAAEDVRYCGTFLETLFRKLCPSERPDDGLGPLGSQPWLLESAACLVREYAAWFGSSSQVCIALY